MKIVLTGGCTGGHIYPALAIGEKFRSADEKNEILYIGHEFGLETSIVPKAGFELKKITADWFRRDNPFRIIKTIKNTYKGKREAVKILKEFNPEFVVSTGSFVSVPVVLAANKLNIPIFIQEQNGFPGLSNRILARKAKRIFLGFESAREYFKVDDKKIVYSGNPVREDFLYRDREKDRINQKYSQNDIVLTVFGGSLGSEMTNKIGVSLIEKYKDMDNIKIVLGTGNEYYDGVQNSLDEKGLNECKNIRIMPYMANMPECFSVSDLVICRSGALTVAEIAMSGKAAIFIPSPNVTADHQYYNAKSMEENGAAIIIRENNDTVESVIKKVDEIVSNKEILRKMGKHSFELAPINSLDIIYKTILNEI